MKNCREAQADMALHLGNDLADRAQWEAVRRHVATCSECRLHYTRLKKAMQVLEQSNTEATYEVRESLWPELSQRLQASPPKPQTASFWLPLTSVAVACLLLVAVAIHPPAHPTTHAIHQQQGRGMWSSELSVRPTPAKPQDTSRETPDKSEEEAVIPADTAL